MAEKLVRAIRVVQFGGPEVLKLVTDLAVPKPEEVLTAGVNPVDTYKRSGVYPVLPELPYTPGEDCSGVVEATGPGVSKFKPGDKVYTVRSITGTYAEYTLAQDSHTFRLHSSLGFSQGAAMGIPYFTAYRAIKIRGGAKPGESLLVHGASGAVGIAACQIGQAYGMHVLGTAGTEPGLQLVKNAGATAVFNHRSDDYIKEIQDYLGSKGVDVIVEMLANVNLKNDLQLLGRNGRVMIVGSRGTTEINPRPTMAKESDIRGVALMTSSNAEFEEMSAALYAGQVQGWVRPVVGQDFPLADASKAHMEVIEHSKGTHGKIILSMN